MFRTSRCLTYCLFMLLVVTMAAAQYEEAARDRTGSPYFFIENGDSSVDRFLLEETRVEVNISGVIADVAVTQTYVNGGTRPVNACYIFPASTRAAVYGMKMIIGDEVITARIREKQTAQREFDQAKQEGKSASLLKQQRPNVFSMNVANLMPGDTIHIELRYTELLVPTDGTYEFVYPTVVGPRYANQSGFGEQKIKGYPVEKQEVVVAESGVPEAEADDRAARETENMRTDTPEIAAEDADVVESATWKAEAPDSVASESEARTAAIEETDSQEIQELETDHWNENPYLEAGGDSRMKFDIAVRISTGVPLQEIACGSHDTDILWEADFLASIALKDAETFSGNRDYILKFRLAGKEIQTGLMLFEDKEESFFLLMVQPPERLQPRDIPPMEYIFVVDVSGSMDGFPLETSKELLRDLIGHLRESDRFNVILFAGDSEVMASASVAATSGNIARAIHLIDSQQGGGGTELHAALRRGFSLPRDEAFSRTILVITDGYVTFERNIFEEIQNNLQRTNLFAFGIGSSVNRYLIEGMSKSGQGEPFVVTDPFQAAEAARKFREYVQSPVLTNISVTYNGFESYDIEPEGIPALFAKRPLVVIGKWRGRAEGNVTITGTTGSGNYSRTFPVQNIPPLETNRALRYLWARSRIARLSDFSGTSGNPDNEGGIVALGLAYNLLTPYTSFIAVSEIVRNPGGQGDDVRQPLPLPLHASNRAVSGCVASVPEPEILLLLVLAALMGLALFVSRKWS